MNEGIAAIAFDAFGTLFDLNGLRAPARLIAAAGGAEAERGDVLFEGFARRLVPWTWHSTASRRYRPFPDIARAALVAAALEAKVALEDPDQLVEELSKLSAYPDVASALSSLAPLPLVLLSNGTQPAASALLQGAGLGERFEQVLTADDVGCYKPSPEVYALAVRALALPAERIMLVTAHEWDVAGARAHGLRTAWVGRGKSPQWVLGMGADVTLNCLGELAELVASLGNGRHTP